MTAGSISYTRGEDPLRADKLNASFSERLLVVGDTMLGPLILFRDPQVPFEAVTKQYTDALVTSKLTGFLSTTGGTMYGPLFLFRDPQTAMEASTKQYTDAKAASVAAGYLPLTGGTLTGVLTLAADAIAPLQPVTLHQLSTQGSSASIAVGDTPPTPGLNKLWWDSVACQLYIWFDDGTSSQWVPAMAVPASVGEAPTGGSIYGRQSGQWTDLGTTSLSKNLLHNSLFSVAQRGAGAFAANGSYTVDRWAISFGAGEANSVTRVAMDDSGRAAIGDEAAQFILGNTFTGAAGAANYNQVFQRLEGVRRLAGKTVTVSFWANSTIASLKVGVSFNQYFGSGGSPSTGVTGAGQSATLSSSAGTWTKQVLTLAIPSAAGKTLGTNGDDFTQFNLWFSAGASNATASGSVGVQSGYIGLWGVQLEIGNIATALEKIDPQQDLAKCQRFYQIGNLFLNGYQTISNSIGIGSLLPVAMRATPTVSVGPNNNSSGIGAITFGAVANATVYATGIASATGACSINTNFVASADL